MKISTALLAITLSVATSVIHAADPRPQQAGWKVTLDRGPVLELLVITSETTGRVTRTVVMRDTTKGESISARDENDLAWGTSDLEIADGDRRLRLRMSLDFLKDGLAVPVELRIGDEFYRALWDPPSCPGAAKAKERLQAAAAKLPASMLNGMAILWALGFDQDLGIDSISAGIEPLFPNGLPKVQIAEKERLTAEQIDALVRQTKR